MSRLKGLGGWLLSCWPLALRETVIRQEAAMRSLAGEIERLEEAQEQLLAELDQAKESRRRALSRAHAAERERDALRSPQRDRLSVVLLHREHPSDAVLDRIDRTVEEVS